MRDNRYDIPLVRSPATFEDPRVCDGTHTYGAVCVSKDGVSDPVSCTIACPCKIGGLTAVPEAPSRIRVHWNSPSAGCCEHILVALTCDGVGTSSVSLPGSQTEIVIDGCAAPFDLQKVCVSCITADDLMSEATCAYLPRVPGTPVFVRGDANADETVDISDAMTILGYLFLGVPENLSCKETADTNDSEGVDVSDSVYLLNYLFLGGPPISPFPECGIDPTPDLLGCNSYPCG